MKFLVSFSAYSNGRALLSTSEVPGSISAINGIKFLTMTWIITSHTYYLLFIGYACKYSYFLLFYSSVYFHLVNKRNRGRIQSFLGHYEEKLLKANLVRLEEIDLQVKM